MLGLPKIWWHFNNLFIYEVIVEAAADACTYTLEKCDYFYS